MEAKEANAAAFLKKQSHNIRFQQKLLTHCRTRENSRISLRSLIKKFDDFKKEARLGSEKGIPRSRKNGVGNSSKTLCCGSRFQSFKRAEKKKNTKHFIHFEQKTIY